MNYRRKLKVRSRYIGDEEPVFIIGEIGIKHNGSIELAKKLIEGALITAVKK